MLKIGSNGKPEFPEIFDFSAQTAEGDFLFGPEIRKYLDEISSRAVNLSTARAEYRDFMNPIPPPPITTTMQS